MHGIEIILCVHFGNIQRIECFIEKGCLHKLGQLLRFLHFCEICIQQHGTVYWAKGSREILKNLNPSKYLHEELSSCFSLTSSPTWMDSSTKKECTLLENVVGGSMVKDSINFHNDLTFSNRSVIIFPFLC